uniref:UspA domain-containing protein n=1 Tax=Arion vulgaris TaxID=1028688 RepID=A0A0B7ANQ4_9EUPU
MRRQLIALDGKDESYYALEWYLNNVCRSGDEAVIFHCSQFTLNVGLPGAATNVELVSKKVQDALKKAEEITTKASEKIKTKGIKCYVIIKSGLKPEEAILQAVTEENVTHVIMGTRGLGTLQRAFVGSVSSTVVSNAKVPVTIVKKGL